MKKKLVSLIASGLLKTASALGGQPIEEAKPEGFSIAPRNFYAETNYSSQYLGTYGFTLSQGPVVQSQLGFNFGNSGLSYNFWTNYDLGNGVVKGQGLNEIDNTLTAKLYSGKYLDVKTNFVYFTFPNTQIKDAYSIDLVASSKGLPIDLTLVGVQAYGEQSNNGRLGQLIVGKSVKLDDKNKLNFESRLTYVDDYFVQGSGFSTASFGVSMPMDLGKGFTFTPSWRMQKSFDEKKFGGTFIDNSGVFGVSLKKEW